MILNSACDTNNNWNSRYKITLLILHISTAVYHQYFGNTCLLLSLCMSDELFTRRQVMIINRKQLRNLHYTSAKRLCCKTNVMSIFQVLFRSQKRPNVDIILDQLSKGISRFCPYNIIPPGFSDLRPVNNTYNVANHFLV